MLIRDGYETAFRFPQPTAIAVLLYVHPSCASTIQTPERFEVEPRVPISEFVDSFGNRCGRLFVPAGRVVSRNDATVEDSGQPDPQAWNAPQHDVQDLPNEVLLFLLASRYCEVDSELKDFAGTLFNSTPRGWPRVQSICDSSTNISASTTSRRGPIGRRWRPFASASASAAIIRTWPSRFADA